MNRNRRLLEFAFFAMVCISSLLLGLGQGNLSLTVIAIALALLGLVIVDWLQVFSLPRWIANILSIVVLFITMRGFFGDQSGAQLIAVANLLVYLQSLLMLQEKSPRQYWQLVVLNLLQIVVAAVFVLNLEGGLLFLLYMVFAAFFLCLLTTYDEDYRLKQMNEHGRDGVSFFDFFQSSAAKRGGLRMIYDANPMPTQFYQTAATHLMGWIVASLAFSMVLFVLIPRHQMAWFAGSFTQVSRTGATKQVDLDERGVISISNDPVLRARFRDPRNNEPLSFATPPYFRGMALSSLVIRNGKTTFEAPYDRIYSHHYLTPPYPERNLFQQPRRGASVDITLEPTSDPLMYGVMPAMAMVGNNTPAEMCLYISALTRRRNSEQVELTPYQYVMATYLNNQGELLSAWPYIADGDLPSARDMAGNPAEFRWLTEIDKSRYPELVAQATALTKEAGSKNHIDIARRMESHFWDTNIYSYTLNYTGITRDENLDPIEDFVRNHRQGHCEVFASALVLMLRSQGIPARLVVGYCGGAIIDDFYAVTNANAHAWVEAYIRPEDCTQSMFDSKEAGRGGSWLRLDPTPSSELFANSTPGGNSLVRARTLWQDYVLGLSNDNQGDFIDSPSNRFLGMMDFSNASTRFQTTVDSIQRNPAMQAMVIILAILVLLVSTYFTFRVPKQNSGNPNQLRKVSIVRRWAARALALFSPQLGEWMLDQGSAQHKVPFYERFKTFLRRYQIERKLGETPRDLGNKATTKFQNAPETTAEIQRLVAAITEGFSQVRFGNRRLDSRESQKYEADLKRLEELVQKPK